MSMWKKPPHSVVIFPAHGLEQDVSGWSKDCKSFGTIESQEQSIPHWNNYKIESFECLFNINTNITNYLQINVMNQLINIQYIYISVTHTSFWQKIQQKFTECLMITSVWYSHTTSTRAHDLDTWRENKYTSISNKQWVIVNLEENANIPRYLKIAFTAA